ncbi:MAG: hypothetical protein WCF04_05180 [Candidatus Nanopelagicales bacterium]
MGALPVGGTLTIDEMGAPEFTFGVTQEELSLGATNGESTVEVVAADDTVSFRVQLGEEDEPSASDLAMIDSFAPGLTPVLAGKWVSIDVSEDSALAKELAKSGSTTEVDPEMEAAVHGLTTTAQAAWREHVTIERGTSPAARPAGSDQYDLIVDARGLYKDLLPSLQEVVQQSFATSMDHPMAGSAGLTPAAVDQMAGEALDQLTAAIPDTLPTIHVWIDGNRFTQVIVDSDPSVTLSLTQEPVMVTPVEPIPLDDALVGLLKEYSDAAALAGNADLTGSGELSAADIAEMRDDPAFAGMTDEEFDSIFAAAFPAA